MSEIYSILAMLLHSLLNIIFFCTSVVGATVQPFTKVCLKGLKHTFTSEMGYKTEIISHIYNQSLP